MNLEPLRPFIEEANRLKLESQNRHDATFKQWHRDLREWFLRNTPVKLPAFDEIRFASDFLLSKPEAQQREINDRIALVCDLDLALELMDQAQAIVDKEQQRALAAQAAAPADASPTDPAPADDWAGLLREQVKAMNFSAREQEEILEELQRLETALNAPEPDWDRIKRTLKFLLDFDRTLAIRTVPGILARLDKS